MLLFIRVPFYVLLVFVGMCSVFWLFLLSLLAKWLARNTPLRKRNCGKGIVSIKPRPKRSCACVGILHSIMVYLHDICVVPWPYVIYFLLLWHDIVYMWWKCRKTLTSHIACMHVGGPKNFGDAVAFGWGCGWLQEMLLPTYVNVPNFVALGQTVQA